MLVVGFYKILFTCFLQMSDVSQRRNACLNSGTEPIAMTANHARLTKNVLEWTLS